MASLHNYRFDNLTRIGDDVCGISERDIQNQNFGSYTTQNYFEKFCDLTHQINLATNQPNIFLSGSVGSAFSGAGGCNIDNDSNLRIKRTQTNPKGRISLRERPYKSIPYLGRGPSMPLQESKLQQGIYLETKKNCKMVTEKSYRTRDSELIPSLKATIQNPNNLIEGMAAEGWIRGGLPTRELTRDNDYLNK
jgi:hypothetical protein